MQPSIQQFLSGRTLLITGATGFLGKALLEKILRSCPGVGRIYLLLRPKSCLSSHSAQVRLEREILASRMFDPLRHELGDRFDAIIQEKVRVVPGDLQLPRLGLSEPSWSRLAAEVDVIFNSAASVLFDERLDTALELNALGPVRLLDLARAGKARAFLHVSTAYVSGLRPPRPVPAAPIPRAAPGAPLPGDCSAADGIPLLPADTRAVVEQLLETSRQIVAAGASSTGRRPRGARTHSASRTRSDRYLRQRLVEEGMACARRYGWPDVYTFTKALGEQMIIEHHGEVPAVIVRPAIIESSLREPLPGWVEGCRMADPLIIAYGRCLLDGYPADPKVTVDFVPLDTVVNAVLGASTQATPENGIQIYHVATSGENPMSFGALVTYLHDYFRGDPMRDRAGQAIRTRRWPFSSPGQSERRRRRRRLQAQVMGRLLDRLPGMQGQQARLTTTQAELDRLEHLVRIYAPYSLLDARFDTASTCELYRSLPAEEQALFPFDVTRIDWRHYIQEVHVPGLRRYVLKQEEAEWVRPPRAGADPSAPMPGPEAPIVAGLDEAGMLQERPATPDAALRASSGRGGFASPAILHRGRVQDGARWAASQVNRLILERWFQLRVEGREHLPAGGPYLIAANHTSHLDYGALFAATGAPPDRTFALGARDYFFNTPLRAVFYSTLNVLPFERHGSFVADLQLCRRALEMGKILVVFPEGTRSVTGELLPFKPGIAMLALWVGVPIVPAGIEGAFEALPKGTYLPRRRPLTVRFGPALQMAPYQERRSTLSNHRLYRAIVEDLRVRIDALLAGGAGETALGSTMSEASEPARSARTAGREA